MIHVVHAANRHLYSEVLTRLYAARHQHFVVERGWPLTHFEGLEQDAYDDHLALNLIGLEADREIAVSCRVRPTLTGGVLPDVFPGLLAASEPSLRVEGAYECTRYFCAAHLRGRAGFGARSSLHIALLELMQAHGAERLVGFVDLPVLNHLRRYSGLNLRVVGEPQLYSPDAAAIAFEIGFQSEDLEAARLRLALAGRQLFDAPAWLTPNVDTQALADVVDIYCRGEAEQVSQISGLTALLSEQLRAANQADLRFDQLAQHAA